MKKVVFLVVLMLLVGAGLFAEQIVIGYACRRLTNPYWVMTKNGVEDAAAKYGVKVILYDCQNDPAIQRNNVEDLIQAKVDAILITSIVTGSRASGAAADAAVRAGIPVIGVPLDSSALNGMDALLSVVQMPPGIPVATVAVGKPGAANAAILAARILSIKYDDIRSNLDKYRESLKQK